ncbi:MAG: roadblock/LC7 domain-containing protein [Anaerolineae bacterium]|nr:roadblock/LC7 domain-containing protein [Anaerolineae bacterium]
MPKNNSEPVAETPEHTPEMATLQAGIRAALHGDKILARKLLLQVTTLNPAQEEAWLWLAGVTDELEEAQAYLQTVLALNPSNQQAQAGLRWIESRLDNRDGQRPLPQSSATVQRAFSLSREQAEAIDRVMDKIAYESEARCIILADVTGQLISARGQTEQMNTQVLSALAAGELAATHEMARLVGERARFKLLLHEGEHHSVYLSDIGEQLILIIVFDNETPIGLVRMILRLAVDRLLPLIAQEERSDSQPTAAQGLSADFARLLQSVLDSSLK